MSLTETEPLAEVITLRTVENLPRDYRRRVYVTEPPASQPFARQEFHVEELLSRAWDEQRTPYQPELCLLGQAGEERARELIDDLFAAADEAADEQLAYGQPSMRAMDAQSNALWDLAAVLRGAA